MKLIDIFRFRISANGSRDHADKIDMQMNESFLNRRSSERVALPAERPVYFTTAVDGMEVCLFVENLSMGGALLMCPDICESLRTGQRLSNGVLVLSDANSTQVNLIVRWQLWPRVGVQFDGISHDANAKISQLLRSLKASLVS